MATGQDQFCGNCGKRRVPGATMCPHCGHPYESLAGTTLVTPTEVAPRPTQPVWGTTIPPTIYPGSTDPTLPAHVPPGAPTPKEQGKPLPWGKIFIGQSIIIALLVVLVVVLLLRPTSPGTSNTGNAPLASGSTATAATGMTPTLAPTATPTPIPSPTPTSIPSLTAALPCVVDVGTWTGSADWKPSNGVLLNDGSNSFYFGGPPTIVAPCQLGDTNNYAVETTIQVISINRGTACFGITVRGSTSSSGWQGYVAAVEGGGGCHTLYGTLDDVSISAGSPSPPTVPFKPGTAVHTYRVEVNGNVIKFLVDGAELISLTDNSYLSGAQVGLRCGGVQLEVKSFKVVAL